MNMEPSFAEPISQLATKRQCDSAEYQGWMKELKADIDSRWLEPNQVYNRKVWEWGFILQALKVNGLLQAGKTGLGFGVGREPLVAAMAKNGCQIVATDLPSEDAVRNGWDNLGQYSFNVNELNQHGICDPVLFNENVEFRDLNMNHVDGSLGDFDFVYSSCALEHLGTLDLGLDFIRNSLKCLKPGGVAIHTTEYNVSSNDNTLAEGGTVLYRKSDIESLVEELKAQGYEIKLNLSAGEDSMDEHYDVPPYLENGFHLKLLMSEYVITSIGLIIKRPE